MEPSNQKQRTRLTPAARKQQIIEAAKTLILASGLEGFTMDMLAATAGITTPLVYKYFVGREELLQALLAQEYESFAGNVRSQLAGASNLEEVVKIFITSNFDHFRPGNVLPLLQNQPEIAKANLDQQRKYQSQTAKFLVQITSESFQFTTTQAELVITMSSAASIAAAQFSAKTSKADKRAREESIQTALVYVMGGLESVAKA